MSAVWRGDPRGLLVRPLSLIGPEIGVAVFADWLFWAQDIGLSFPFFCAVLAIAAHLRRPSPSPRRRAIALVSLLIGLAPAVEHLNLVSATFAMIATSAAAGLALPMIPSASRAALEAAVRWIAGPRRICQDVRSHAIWRRRHHAFRASRRTARLVWMLPLMAGSVFLSLFADANPVIADLLSWLPWPTFDLSTLFPRAVFWIGVAVVVWPVVRPRRTRSRRNRTALATLGPDAHALPALHALLFNEAAILRTLLLCNALFALQLVLDGVYLWAGAGLPHGMTYAQYAHRGAYPLVLTALIAGGFMLLLRREDTRVGSPRVTTGLMLLFTGQNVVLVCSAGQRLKFYVDAYGLTEWRVAAFCWMGLVACGLVLIAVQVASDRSSVWLAQRAAVATAAVLYGWCLADVPGIVASYDVAHCAEATGTGPALDVDMLLDLGPSALPAIEAVRHRLHLPALDAARDDWAGTVSQDADNWRTWSFRTWRLARWLDSVDGAMPENVRGERGAQ